MPSLAESNRKKAIRLGRAKYSSKPCVKHGQVARHTSDGTCVVCKSEQQDAFRIRGRDLDIPIEYFAGRKARSSDLPKAPQEYLTSDLRHWWLAGWNDRDIEMTKTKKNAPARINW